MKHIWFYFLLSGLVIVPGVISLVFFGLKPSIDFTGGTLWEIEAKSNPSIGGQQAISEEIKKIFREQKLTAEVQVSGANRFLIRTVPLDSEKRLQLFEKLKGKIGDFKDIRFETLGPRIGRELLFKALWAVVLATLAILAYIAYSFKGALFGVAAISAALHDAFVLLGVFSLLGYFFKIEVDTLFVTAFLTTLSFSVHDTVIVFDRIREIRRRTEAADLKPVINQAIGETLVRSLNNSLTVIFVLTALFFLGGEQLRWFVFALLIGMITGTYSSIFNAAPLLLVLPKISSVLRLFRGKRVETFK